MNDKPKAPREYLDPQGSSRSGFLGWYEKTLRRFKGLILGATLLLILCAIVVLLGISIMPSILIVRAFFGWAENQNEVFKLFLQACSIAFGFFAYGFSTLLVIPLANRLVLPFVRPGRGSYYSISAFGWYLHNILTYMVRYTFLDLITPTPFSLFFYRAMGMKIGKHAELNTSNVSDPALITLEDNVTVGGSATLLAHYAVGGFLIISPLVIRKGATIGLQAIIMGGVEIGAGAKILPNSVVLPKTVVPAGETWSGVPAKKVEKGS